MVAWYLRKLIHWEIDGKSTLHLSVLRKDNRTFQETISVIWNVFLCDWSFNFFLKYSVNEDSHCILIIHYLYRKSHPLLLMWQGLQLSKLKLRCNVTVVKFKRFLFHNHPESIPPRLQTSYVYVLLSWY